MSYEVLIYPCDGSDTLQGRSASPTPLLAADDIATRFGYALMHGDTTTFLGEGDTEIGWVYRARWASHVGESEESALISVREAT